MREVDPPPGTQEGSVRTWIVWRTFCSVETPLTPRCWLNSLDGVRTSLAGSPGGVPCRRGAYPWRCQPGAAGAAATAAPVAAAPVAAAGGAGERRHGCSWGRGWYP